VPSTSPGGYRDGAGGKKGGPRGRATGQQQSLRTRLNWLGQMWVSNTKCPAGNRWSAGQGNTQGLIARHRRASFKASNLGRPSFSRVPSEGCFIATIITIKPSPPQPGRPEGRRAVEMWHLQQWSHGLQELVQQPAPQGQDGEGLQAGGPCATNRNPLPARVQPVEPHRKSRASSNAGNSAGGPPTGAFEP